jgi:hypothetical protein
MDEIVVLKLNAYQLLKSRGLNPENMTNSEIDQALSKILGPKLSSEDLKKLIDSQNKNSKI